MPRNKLYYGDNLDVLRKYVRDETVDLCYIDPPFNSKRNYNQIYNNIGHEDQAQAQAFVDTWTWDDHANDCLAQILDNENGVQTQQSQGLIKGLLEVLGKGSLLAYLVSMTVRIAEIHRALKPTGSFYLHCDPTASHYLKLVCDALFCSRGGDYRNEIIWRRTNAHNKLSKQYGPIHDVILFYVKSESVVVNHPKRPFIKSYIATNFPYEDEKGRFQSNVLTGSGVRTGESGATWKGYNPTPKGRHWAIPSKLSAELGIDVKSLKPHAVLDLLDEKGLILHPKGADSLPRYKQYLELSGGVQLQDIWAYQPGTAGILQGTNEGIDQDVKWLDSNEEKLGYPTQKPAGLLDRIISASSKEGDVVLDAFCGCGTTIAVAQILKRNWIGIDITYQSIALILKRLRETLGVEAIQNIELHGIPRDMDGVRALVNKKDDRVRKEFEKWAVLTYSDNRAVINEKKGADQGIDGIAYVAVGRNVKGDIAVKPVIFSVKSGKVGAGFMRDLRGTIEREDAAAGILITLEESTAPMRKEAKQAGQFKGDFATFDRLQIVTVQEILDGARMNLPMYAEVVKKARGDSGAQQNALFSGDENE